ncbi:MAG TPA: hypothetical protein PLD84_13300 [Chitinophagales bacterium]|nr:hypothetical protein [Chitinophagales bacterium]
MFFLLYWQMQMRLISLVTVPMMVLPLPLLTVAYRLTSISGILHLRKQQIPLQDFLREPIV